MNAKLPLLIGTVATILLTTAATTSACGASTTGSGQQATTTTAAITYEVTGRSAGNITYTTDGAGSQEQQQDVTLPWRKTINVPAGFAFVSLLAQNGGKGQISCKITDSTGKVIKQATSSGAYAIASCSGSIS